MYNHSSQENAVPRYDDHNHTIKIFANKQINKGDEITINYGPKYWSSRNIVPSSN